MRLPPRDDAYRFSPERKQQQQQRQHQVDADENDTGSEWSSDNGLYRRMLRGSQRIQMMQRHRRRHHHHRHHKKQQREQQQQQQQPCSILKQALEQADVAPNTLSGIKVLQINIFQSQTFDVRYFTIDKSREYICLTPDALPPNLLASGHCHLQYCHNGNEKKKRNNQWNNNNNNNNNSQNIMSRSFRIRKSSTTTTNHQKQQQQQQEEERNAPLYQFIDIADIDAWHVGVVATHRAEVARRLESTRSKGKSSFDEVATEKLLTLYYQSGKTIDLVVPVTAQLNMIVSSLAEIHSTFHRTQPWISKESSLLRYISKDMDMGIDQRIGPDEFERLCQRLHVGVDRDIRAAFLPSGTTNQTAVPYSECINMLRSLKPKRSQALILWEFLFGQDPTKTISHKELHSQFLLQIQSESHVSLRQAQALLTFIQTIEVSPPQGGGNPQDDSSRTTLQKYQFEEFLYSDVNDAYDPEMQQMEHYLDQPISSYWINTSFKTSRNGNGNAAASVEGYMKALIRGCKCLDVDCWDGPLVEDLAVPIVGQPKKGMDQPHFKHVCDVIEAYLNMYPGTYPIILSIENYCSPSHQDAMATLLTTILGKRLYLPEDGNHFWKEEAMLPSPEALKGRVLLHSKDHCEIPQEMEWWFQRQRQRHSLTTQQQPSARKLGFGFGNTNESAKKGPLSSWLSFSSNSSSGTIVPIQGDLKRLVFFSGGKLQDNLDVADQCEQPWTKLVSIAGNALTRMVPFKRGETSQRRHNASHLTRTHPSDDNNRRRRNATNISINPNPIQAWSLGCQMVALQLEGRNNNDDDDDSIVLNDGLFRQGNGCGYVQKPPFILGLGQPTQPLSLFVRILGGRCLPSTAPATVHSHSENQDQLDLYAKVTLYDVQMTKEDTEEVYRHVYTATSMDGNGFAPVWKDRGKKFVVQQPGVAMVLFQVMGRSDCSRAAAAVDVCVASAAIPVACLRKGYRSIQFFDDNNCRTGALRYASLLAHIEY